MSTKLSTVLTNLTASPQTLNTAGKHGGKVRVLMDSFELAATDVGASDVVLLDKIPANAVILGIWLMSDDLDSGTTATTDVGLFEYDSDADLTTPVAADDDCFASAITTLRAATVVWTDVFCEAGTAAVANIGKKVYEWAGDSQGDFNEYIVGLTFDAAGDQAGTLAYKIEYIVP